ncbi:hypothetical protein STEG23_004005, partial [Scotinomys teguina]
TSVLLNHGKYIFIIGKAEMVCLGDGPEQATLEEQEEGSASSRGQQKLVVHYYQDLTVH